MRNKKGFPVYLSRSNQLTKIAEIWKFSKAKKKAIKLRKKNNE